MIPLEAASSYVITGKRHAPGPIDSNFSYGKLDLWSTITNIGHDQLRIDPDGTYTITLDNQPADGRANHIQLTPDGDTLFIRNTLADWASENVDSIAVKRVAGPLAVPMNVLPQPGKPGDKAGFLVTQRNALGHFRLSGDEALVATINPGGAAYTTFPVTNVWGVTPDYWSHQSSLNNHQAVPNPDGTITVVLSAWDPSVYNWVDTSGLEEGIVMLRWQGLPKQASATGEPGVESKVVKRAADAEGCDFPGFGPHSFRRANITLLQAVGGSSIEASKMAGHSTVRMTEEYTKIQLTRQEEPTRLIQDRFANVGGRSPDSLVH